ncbi:hypothetical protein As57867_006027, partial [Aphanomyces stellatus]
IWFRKGLRLHDNLALIDATRGASHLIPLVVIDPFLVHPDRCGARPLQFFLECLEDLDQSLRQLHASRLVVLTGDPVEVIPRVAQDWRVSKLCYEMDTGRYGSIRDAKVTAALASTSTQLQAFPGHTLYAADDVRAAYGPTAYPQKYEDFLKRTSHLVVGDPVPAPPSIPPLPTTLVIPTVPDHPIPTLSELGFPDVHLPPIDLVGGESHALAMLDASMAKKAWVRNFAKPETSPFSPPASTTRLSPYLSRGCLSARLFYSRLQAVLQPDDTQQSKKPNAYTKPPVSLLGQLLWREFYYACSYLTPNYYSMEGNPVCRQIPWSQDETKLQAWTHGRTGYPWIDAAMTQLRQEGWIHHLARHAVACFLTRGDLWIDWRLGRDVFDKLLLDTDPALNNGNWLWLSASAYFHQYFRVYGPVSFAKKYKHGAGAAYVQRHLPILRKLPEKYVLEPWKAPLAVQKAAGCVVGQDYPERIVDHDVESKQLIERMAAAYQSGRK